MRNLESVLLFFQKHHFSLYKVVLLVVIAWAAAWLLPSGSNPGVNYIIGEPWPYDDLVAEASFPIAKSAEEVAKSDREVENLVPFFFARDTVSVADYLDGMGLKGPFRGKAKALLLKGVFPYDARPDGGDGTPVMVMNGGVFEPMMWGERPDQKQAVVELERMWAKAYPDSGIQAFTLPPATLIRDMEARNLMLERERSRITKVEGLVFAGERIVARGQVVTPELARRLDSYVSFSREGNDSMQVLSRRMGHFWLAALLLAMLFLFLYRFRPFALETTGTFSFIFILWLFDLVLAKLVALQGPQLIYLAPFAIVPVMIRAFFDTRIALFVHYTAMLMCAFLAPQSLQFIYLQFITGFFALLAARRWYKRSQLFISAAQITGIYILGYMGWMLLSGEVPGKEQLTTLLIFAGNGFLTLFAFPLIYFSERIFGLVSDVTLLELSDTNHPLLRELAERAPGTFQHSLQVANLAESAAQETGGNTLLVRVGALFHDVGKLRNPQYFIENQSSGYNPHQDLPFEESAKVIIAHVREGITLARQYNLPDRVVDFIRTHHGTSTVQYFYRQYIRDFPEDPKALARFTYPGPKPFSLETALLMMADSIEAASRSLDNPSKEAIDALVEGIVNHQVREGQFESAPITFKDIQVAKREFKKKLDSIYHHRVAYPETSEVKE